MRALVPEDLDRRDDPSVERRAWTRAITARVLALAQRGEPTKILRDAWPDDRRAATILRAVSVPTDTSATAIAPTIVESFRSLAPGSAALNLFAQPAALKVDMTGIAQIKIPHLGSLPPQPIFIAEGAPAPALQLSFAASTLGPVKKILLLAAVSGEIENAVPESASAVIARCLSDATNKSTDVIAFDANAGSATRPPGLLFGAVPIAPAAAGVDAMCDDLAALVAAIGAAGIDTRDVVFVCSPREATIIKVKASPKFDSLVLPTLGLPAKTVVCIAPMALASGYRDAPEVETSREAAYHFEDTSPLPIGTPGAPPTIAAPTRSLFQENVIGVKVRARLAWCVAPGGAQIVSGINW
jgi:hypothetical protein